MATTGVHGLWQGVDVDAARRQQPTWAEEQEGNTRRRPVSAGLAKECVRVVIRVRPMLTRDERLSQSCVRLLHDSNQIVVGRKTAKVFAFDHLFAADSTQTQVFETCALPLLNDVWNGYNATVLAYGQTGSGKTYTMGTSAGEDGAAAGDAGFGIIPSVIDDLFDRVEAEQEAQRGIPSAERTATVLACSYVEIYNEQVRDLLHPSASAPSSRRDGGGRAANNIHIRENERGQIHVQGIDLEETSSRDAMWALFERGSAARVVGGHKLNAASSRSHSIFTIFVSRTNRNANGVSEVKQAKFHLVDLAGSERAKRTGTKGLRFKESISINQGLLALGNVISALADKRRRQTHIPYRQSKLTRLLQDALGGNSRTVMVACISPAGLCFEETLNTLKYANRARNIKNTPVLNLILDSPEERRRVATARRRRRAAAERARATADGTRPVTAPATRHDKENGPSMDLPNVSMPSRDILALMRDPLMEERRAELKNRARSGVAVARKSLSEVDLSTPPHHATGIDNRGAWPSRSGGWTVHSGDSETAETSPEQETSHLRNSFLWSSPSPSPPRDRYRRDPDTRSRPQPHAAGRGQGQRGQETRRSASIPLTTLDESLVGTSTHVAAPFDGFNDSPYSEHSWAGPQSADESHIYSSTNGGGIRHALDYEPAETPPPNRAWMSRLGGLGDAPDAMAATMSPARIVPIDRTHFLASHLEDLDAVQLGTDEQSTVGAEAFTRSRSRTVLDFSFTNAGDDTTDDEDDHNNDDDSRGWKTYNSHTPAGSIEFEGRDQAAGDDGAPSDPGSDHVGFRPRRREWDLTGAPPAPGGGSGIASSELSVAEVSADSLDATPAASTGRRVRRSSSDQGASRERSGLDAGRLAADSDTRPLRAAHRRSQQQSWSVAQGEEYAAGEVSITFSAAAGALSAHNASSVSDAEAQRAALDFLTREISKLEEDKVRVSVSLSHLRAKQDRSPDEEAALRAFEEHAEGLDATLEFQAEAAADLASQVASVSAMQALEHRMYAAKTMDECTAVMQTMFGSMLDAHDRETALRDRVDELEARERAAAAQAAAAAKEVVYYRQKNRDLKRQMKALVAAAVKEHEALAAEKEALAAKNQALALQLTSSLCATAAPPPSSRVLVDANQRR